MPPDPALATKIGFTSQLFLLSTSIAAEIAIFWFFTISNKLLPKAKVLFLKNSKTPVNINKLQTEVWGHNSKLETHTVETHIYRLRKKIQLTFSDENFITSSKSGYLIKWK